MAFHFQETIAFQQDQQIQEMLGIGLEPVITFDEQEHTLSIRGVMELKGEYIKSDSPIELVEREPSGTYVEQVEPLSDTVNEFFHKLLIDISLPAERVESSEDLAIHVNHFDYTMKSAAEMEIEVNLAISGLRGQTENEESEEEEIFSLPAFREEQEAVTTEGHFYIEMEEQALEDVQASYLEKENISTEEADEVSEQQNTVEDRTQAEVKESLFKEAEFSTAQEEHLAEQTPEKSENVEGSEVAEDTRDNDLETTESAEVTELDQEPEPLVTQAPSLEQELAVRQDQPSVPSSESAVQEEAPIQEADAMTDQERSYIQSSESAAIEEPPSKIVRQSSNLDSGSLDQVDESSNQEKVFLEQEEAPSETVRQSSNLDSDSMDQENQSSSQAEVLLKEEVPSEIVRQSPNLEFEEKSQSLANKETEPALHEVVKRNSVDETEGEGELANMRNEQERTEQSNREDVTEQGEAPVIHTESSDEPINDTSYLSQVFQDDNTESSYSRLKLYIVQPHDQINQIAERYQVSPNQIKRSNQLEQEDVLPGQIIYIPVQSK